MARKCLQIFVWWILCGIPVLVAQRYPVTATTMAQPPLTPTLEYFTSEHLRVLLLLNDAQAGSVQVRLRFTIEGSGVRMQTSPDYLPPPLELTYGIPLLLTGQDLGDYLDPSHLMMQGISLNAYQQAGKLPEGFYSICVEVYDYRRQETPISNQGCTYPYLEELEPPVITAPQEQVLATEPQQILFSWLPQHLGAFPVQYTLYVYEWTDGLSLDQVWAYQAPVTVESMTSSFLWGPGEVPLDTGKTYVVRVRIEDVQGEAVFKNNGYSQEQVFRIQGWPPEAETCKPPGNLNARLFGPTAVLSWSGVADTFRIDYWEDVAQSKTQWLRTGESSTQINYLEPGKSYRITLSGYCGSSWLHGGDTLLITLSPARDTQVICGQEVPVFDNQDPLLQLLPGDVVSAGGIPIEIITSTGGDGSFSGTGAFRLKYAPTVRLGVDFYNIKVNAGYQLIDGQLQTRYDPAWGNIPAINLDFTRQPLELAYRELNIPEDVDSVWVDEEGRVWIVDNTGQEREVTQVTDELDEPPVPVLIIDVNGAVWRIIDGVVLEEGQDGVQTVQEQGNTNADGEEILTGSDKALVTFDALEDQDYGFDAMHQEKLASYYERLEGNYYVPFKSVAGARQDRVMTEVVNPGGIALDSIVFESESGSRWPPRTWVQNSAILPVVGKGDAYEEAIYALLRNGKDYQSIGKLNTVSYEPVRHRVILVSVGQKQEVDALGIQDYLNEVYKQAVASWTVEVDEEVLQVDWDPEGDGLYIDRGVIDKYHTELDRIIVAYQEQRGIDQDSYYAFLIPKMQDPTILGFMPRGGSYAFIAGGGDIARTLAHELGHGAFTLEHIFADDAMLQGQTDNLMDYADGQHLMKHQWDRVHDPKTVWGLFEGEEEGKNVLSPTYFCIQSQTLVNFQERCFVTAGGDVIQLPQDVTQLAFYSEQDSDSKLLGRLASFRMDGKVYTVKPDKNGDFDGYHNFNAQSELWNIDKGSCIDGVLVSGSKADCSYTIADLKQQAQDCNCGDQNPDEDQVAYDGMSSVWGEGFEDKLKATQYLKDAKFTEDRKSLIDVIDPTILFSSNILISSDLDYFRKWYEDKLLILKKATGKSFHVIIHAFEYVITNEEKDQIADELFNKVNTPEGPHALLYVNLFKDKVFDASNISKPPVYQYKYQYQLIDPTGVVEQSIGLGSSLSNSLVEYYRNISKPNYNVVYKILPGGEKSSELFIDNEWKTGKDAIYSFSVWEYYQLEPMIITDPERKDIQLIGLGWNDLMNEARLHIDEPEYFSKRRIYNLKEQCILQYSDEYGAFANAAQFITYFGRDIDAACLYDDLSVFDVVIYPLIDGASFVPVLGAVPDLAGMVISGARGDVYKFGEYSFGFVLNFALGGKLIELGRLADMRKALFIKSRTQLINLTEVTEEELRVFFSDYTVLSELEINVLASRLTQSMDKAELICSEKIYRYLEESSYNGKFDEAIEVLFGGSRYLDEFFDLLKQKYLKAGADEVKAGLLAQKTHDFFTERGYDISSLTDELAEVLVKAEDGVQVLARLQGWNEDVFDVFLKDLADPNLKGIFRAEWVEAWEALNNANRVKLRIEVDALSNFTNLKSHRNFEILGLTNDMISSIEGIDNISYAQMLAEIESTLDVLPADKVKNFSQIIQSGNKRGLVNSNPINGIYDRRHSWLTLKVIQDNADIFKNAKSIEFEAILETIDGIPQSIPDIKLVVNSNGINKIKIGEVYAGTAGAKSNLATQTLTYIQEITDLMDLRFFRRLNLSDKASAKQAVIDAWKAGSVLENPKFEELIVQFDKDVVKSGFDLNFDSVESFLEKDSTWFEIIFNSKF